MTKLERYDAWSDSPIGFKEEPNGKWVLFSDHEKAICESYQMSADMATKMNEKFKAWKLEVKQKLVRVLAIKNRNGSLTIGEIADEVFE